MKIAFACLAALLFAVFGCKPLTLVANACGLKMRIWAFLLLVVAVGLCVYFVVKD